MSGRAIDIIKRGGQRPTEAFMREKLHASLVAACLSAQCPPGQAESIATAVGDRVMDWLENHPEITSHDLRRIAARHLQVHHPDAGYLYEQHRVIL